MPTKKSLSSLARAGVLAVPVLAFCPSALVNPRYEEKAQQLCYFKNNYIKSGIYDYRQPFFYALNQITNDAFSIISLRDSLFSTSPWELEGVEIHIPPLERNGSVIYWFKYRPEGESNPIASFCQLSSEGFCLFKILYEGDLRPIIDLTGNNSLNFISKSWLKVSIYDSQNNLLRFPADCPEN